MTSKQSAPALLLENVVKAYGSIRAVDGVSFSVWVTGPDTARVDARS